VATGGCRVLIALAANVAVHTDRLLGQTLNDTVRSSTMAVDPFLHVIKHLALNKGIGIMEIGVEQALENWFGNLLGGNIRVIPSVHHSFDCMGHNDSGNVSSRLVKNEVEMIFT